MNIRKGALTVEATIIIPLVLFITVFILYIAIIQYEAAMIFREAENASKNIALYDNPKYNMTNVHDVAANTSYTNYDLYWQLFHQPSFSDHEDYLQTYLTSKIMLPNTVDVSVTEEGFLINKKVVVEISVDYWTPFAKYFGTDGLCVHSISKSNYRNNSEYIRNYDMISQFLFSRDSVKKFKELASGKAGEAAAYYEDGIEQTEQIIDKMIAFLEGM